MHFRLLSLFRPENLSCIQYIQVLPTYTFLRHFQHSSHLTELTPSIILYILLLRRHVHLTLSQIDIIDQITAVTIIRATVALHG